MADYKSNKVPGNSVGSARFANSEGAIDAWKTRSDMHWGMVPPAGYGEVEFPGIEKGKTGPGVLSGPFKGDF